MTERTERVVYQFPISHFCEKTRWNLDAKGLAYRVHDLVPGLHRITARRLSKAALVPILDDRGVVVADSADIARHLDRTYPDRPLVPEDAIARARVTELEGWFGRHAGCAVRQWMYGELMRARPGSAVEAMFAAYPPRVRTAGRLLAPVIEAALRRQLRLDADGIAQARATITEVLDRLEKETGGDPARYLVGGALSIADISAAALIAPLVRPPGSPWEATFQGPLPAVIEDLHAAVAARPAGAWVLARYAQDRAPLREAERAA